MIIMPPKYRFARFTGDIEDEWIQCKQNLDSNLKGDPTDGDDSYTPPPPPPPPDEIIDHAQPDPNDYTDPDIIDTSPVDDVSDGGGSTPGGNDYFDPDPTGGGTTGGSIGGGTTGGSGSTESTDTKEDTPSDTGNGTIPTEQKPKSLGMDQIGVGQYIIIFFGLLIFVNNLENIKKWMR